ncbi:MAG TPA: hypothetical protein PKM41_13250 [Deltaproteobacteria bacterium]|jgi:hypothetical protein|nr:hypothetical protein [Deltaproteobacteria bacterium]HOI07992.1 hypothetical protein [Deltaproteobacteria bacterium]
METITYLVSHFLIIGVIALILLCILAGFCLRFVLPGLRLRHELGKAVAELARLKASSKGVVTDLSDITRRVLAHDMFTHPWQEYCETLHEQKEPGQAARWRSTTLAETFFSETALVDTPLKTEFYKHLPGILTGVGIIGTFSGLIAGLVRFEVSGDAEKVRASLNGLIQSVGCSFVVSAAAITLAMVFIWCEKSLTATCYRLVEKLCQLIDSLFSSGAGEEYLARLVKAAEASARHTAEMRRTLAVDLRAAISDMVKGGTGSNAPQAADPSALVAERLNAAMASLDARQQAMERHLSDFVGQLGVSAQSSQASLSRMAESFVGELGGRMTEIMARLEEHSSRTGNELSARQAQLARNTGTALSEITSQVQELASEMRQASESMRASVATLSGITRESLASLSAGADALNRAVEGLSKAGQGIGSTMAMAGKATERIGIASSNLAQATAGVQGIMEDYGNMSRSFAATVAELKSVIETARKEASMAAHIVSRMEKAAEHLGIAELKAGEYLHGVTEVLAGAHSEFAGNIERTLRKSNAQFHEELSRSVSLISGAIQDFGDVLDSVMEKGEVRCSA